MLWDYDVVEEIQGYMQPLPESNNIVILVGRAMKHWIEHAWVAVRAIHTSRHWWEVYILVALGEPSCKDLPDEGFEDHQPKGDSVVCSAVAWVDESSSDAQDIVYRHDQPQIVQYLQTVSTC